MNTNELADKLHDNFWSQYGYEVRVTNEVRNDGKKKKTYSINFIFVIFNFYN